MRKMIFALAAGLALFGGTSAWAQALDFNVPGGTGSFSYAGGATDLVVAGVGVATITPSGTPLHDGVSLPYSGLGTLAFTSGAYTTAGVASSGYVASSTTLWNFTGGGPITISGTLTTPADTGTQLSGSITSASVQNVGGVLDLSVALFINSIDATLASYLGVPTNGWTGFLHIDFTPATINTNPATGTAFASTKAGSGDIVTTIPEPSSLAIAGLGALGMIGYGLRRRKALGA